MKAYTGGGGGMYSQNQDGEFNIGQNWLNINSTLLDIKIELLVFSQISYVSS
jgi:hypothetical protein